MPLDGHFLCYYGIMKNTHIEHPEDSILNGDISVLDWFTSNGNISAKIDGSPAIVWGRNPATGNYFVGTKSVFNKKLIKINESHEDIDRNHKMPVSDILHACFDNLPRTHRIFQGDFIGFGGNDGYCPNTISYEFEEVIDNNIIIAPHTEYFAEKDLRDAIAFPLESVLESDDNVLFWQPKVTISSERDSIIERCKFARQIATLCEFPVDKQVKRIKQQLNACIRNGLEIDDLTQEALASDNNCDVNVLRLWKLVESIKYDLFNFIERDDDVDCYIDDEECDHEGYVMINLHGTFKIIDREFFSCANFNRVR